LPSLEVLNLAGNGLEDTFPLFASKSMHTLYLGRNRLHGTFPSNIGELLPVLKIFDISNNGFSGTIPDSFSLMHDLDYFDVGKNLIGKRKFLERIYRFGFHHMSLYTYSY